MIPCTRMLPDTPVVCVARGLLSALPKEEFAQLSPHLKTVKLHFRDVLIEPGEPVQDAYFPHSAVISLIAVMANGSSAEAATVGPEGFIGFGGLLGDDITKYRCIVQVGGEASRIDMTHLRAISRRSGSIQDLLFRYIRAHIVQLSQAVACNSLHTVEQRAARWLRQSITITDRAGLEQVSCECYCIMRQVFDWVVA